MPISPVASFRGCPFYVRDIRDSGMGRQVAVHEIINQNPYIEDLGPRTQTFMFDGFVSTDNNLYMSRDLLEAALRVKGLGELLHPTRGMFKAACVEQEIAEVMNEKGLVQVRLVFVAATIKPQMPMTPLALIDTQGNLIGDALSGLGNIGSSLGPLGSTLVSSAVAGATTAATSVGISGIDSIFQHSTCGRYAQGTTNSTKSIIDGAQASQTDTDKLSKAKSISIQNTTQGTANLNTSVKNIGGKI